MGTEKRWSCRATLSMAVVTLFVANACVASTPSIKIESFAVPGYRPSVTSIAAANDGNMWIVETGAFKIGKVSSSGTINEFDLFNTFNYDNPLAIAEGADDRMWFTTYNGYIGAIAVDGSVQAFQANPSGRSFVSPIASGSDKRLYFVEQDNKIGAFSTTGVLSEYSVPTTDPAIWAISSGPDGNIWFTELSGNKIGRLNPSGSIVEFPLPTANSRPTAITAGPDGDLWFIESRCTCEHGTSDSIDVVGRITPSGTVTEFELPSTRGKVFLEAFEGIVAGPDGALWFTESANNRIGRITTSGSISEYDLPAELSVPRSIAASKDGHLWVASTQGENADSDQDNLYKIAISPESDVSIDVTGNWYDPNQSGQGFSLEVLPGNSLIAEWYTFTPSGEPTFIIGTGTYSGSSATLDAYQTGGSGAKFFPNFDAKNVERQHWGTMTFSFSDCSHGQVSWNSELPNYGAGSMNLTQLTRPVGVSCP